MEYKLNQVIDFGKYNGLSIIEVAKKDLGYLCWCLKNNKDFVLDNETLIFLNSNSENLCNSSFISAEFLFEDDDLNLKQKDELKNIIKANIIKLKFLGLHRNSLI